MGKHVLALVVTIAAYYSCTKPLKVIPPAAAMPRDNILEFPPAFNSKIDFTNNNATVVFGDSWTDYSFNANNYIKMFERALLVNQFIDEWKPAGAADRTGGIITSLDQPLDLHFKSFNSTGRKAAYTSSMNGVFLEYDFTCTNVGVSFVGQDTTAMEPYEDPHGRWRVIDRWGCN